MFSIIILKPKLKAGFTITEVLLSLSVLVILAGLSMPVAWSYLAQSDLEVATQVTVQSIRRAQGLALMMSEDSDWGVKIQNNKVILFKGSNFGSRDTEFDEETELDLYIQIQGPEEIIFEKFSGLPNVFGSIFLSNSISQSKEIIVGQKGNVGY